MCKFDNIRYITEDTCPSSHGRLVENKSKVSGSRIHELMKMKLSNDRGLRYDGPGDSNGVYGSYHIMPYHTFDQNDSR